MIIFKYLRWKNFLSTGNVFTEIKLDKDKTSLIIGENGAGKSTILDALSFSLYGKPFRKINKKQLINSINSKEAVVQVEFSIGTHEYKISRSMTKYGTSKFEIYKDDELINQDAAAKDYQEMLEKNILKLNHKSFSQIVVLGNSTFVPFMQLTTQHRREVIEDLLDIQIFSTMNNLLKDKMAENKTSLVQIDYSINLAEQKIEMHKSYIEETNTNIEKRINESNIKIVKAQQEIAQENELIKSLQEQVTQLQSNDLNITALRTKRKKLEQFDYKLQDKIKKISDEILFYKQNDDCPTCKQNMDTTFKNGIIEQKHTCLTETNEGVLKLNQEYEKIDVQIEEVLTTLDEISTIQRQITTHNAHINSLSLLVKSIQEDIEKTNNHERDNTQKNILLNTLEEELKTNRNTKEHLLEQRGVLDVSSLILKDTGIKTRIIKQYTPIMNKLINKYLASMEFFVQFELDENFNETIKSRFRDDFSYESFSEGEKMRIDLALLFTWRAIAKLRNSVSTNLLIMDEVFDSSLDTTGTDEFMKILNEFSTDTNVFIISHKGDQLMDKFQNTIRFEKVKNFSRIAL
jgi:DNA repair exonuclease SbcCD ATPase subunit